MGRGQAVGQQGIGAGARDTEEVRRELGAGLGERWSAEDLETLVDGEHRRDITGLKCPKGISKGRRHVIWGQNTEVSPIPGVRTLRQLAGELIEGGACPGQRQDRVGPRAPSPDKVVVAPVGHSDQNPLEDAQAVSTVGTVEFLLREGVPRDNEGILKPPQMLPEDVRREYLALQCGILGQEASRGRFGDKREIQPPLCDSVCDGEGACFAYLRTSKVLQQPVPR